MYNMVADDIGKDFRVYRRPVDRLLEAILRRPRHQLVTVLNDISFSIPPSSSLGIIGDNGAGKSTLLKILSGTLTPSRGDVRLGGRVAALLELGAGFHPEFSGRQNIYLNAALLGLPREEIQKREQEIIDFSEIEPYIDQPVKTYSSGMYLRLAFSIATSMDPDILIIDEALSVGDLAFQKKCIDRMNRFRERGKTMVFCSHSMYHIQELCEQALWINKGTVRMRGKSEEVASEYTEYSYRKKDEEAEAQIQPSLSSQDRNDCRIRSLRIKDDNGLVIDMLPPQKNVKIEMEVEILADQLTPQFGFGIIKADETPIYISTTHQDAIPCGPYNSGDVITVSHYLKDFPLREGTFLAVGAVSDPGGLLWYEYKKIGPLKVKSDKGLGLMACKHQWSIQKVA